VSGRIEGSGKDPGMALWRRKKKSLRGKYERDHIKPRFGVETHKGIPNSATKFCKEEGQNMYYANGTQCPCSDLRKQETLTRGNWVRTNVWN